MAIFDLFSKRQKRQRGEVSDVYQYDVISNQLRVQLVHIIRDTCAPESVSNYSQRKKLYKTVVEVLCKEYGTFFLPPAKNRYNDQYEDELFNFILQTSDTEKVLDAVEVSFRAIDVFTRNFEYGYVSNYNDRADDAIKELNFRFQESAVGYSLTDGEIIRIDSQLIHNDVVKPALKLLNHSTYSGAQDEYLRAHEHYRKGSNKEALNECLKSFESTMKAICVKRGWNHSDSDTAKNLLKLCFENGLVPPFWQSQLSSLRSMLESSVPTGRNKLSGHGQGADLTQVPEYIAAYMMHMTASSIVFLVSAEEAMP